LPIQHNKPGRTKRSARNGTPTRLKSDCTVSLHRLLHVGRIVLNNKAVKFLTGLIQKGSASKSVEAANLKMVRLNWRALRLLLRLTYGTIRGKHFAPSNRRTIRIMIRLIRAIVHQGRDAIKRFCYKLRLKFTQGAEVRNLRNRGKELEALFIASTASRALQWPETNRQIIKKEEEAALQRLEAPSPLPPEETLAELKAFIGTITKHTRSLKCDRSLPLPAGTACIENPRRKGGSAAEIYRVTRAHQATVGVQALGPARELTQGELFEFAISHAARVERSFKPLPVLTPDGKVRIATLHQARTLWASRALTKFFMPLLKKMSFTSAILRNKMVNLEPSGHGSFAYSADLSKSTDPISIPLARFVLDEVARKVGKPSWYEQAADAVFKEYVYLDSEKKKWTSRCGALMGLGPGWIVLCLLNAFAAYKAGANPSSLAICGDDLSGYWTPSICDEYERQIANLGLQSNKKKSFRGRNGVFCERPVYQVNGRLIAKYTPRMGEVLAADKSQSDHLERITKLHKLLLHEARRTSRQSRIKGGIPGLFRHGGTAGGRATWRTLQSYEDRGAIPLRPSQHSTKMLEMDLLANRSESGIVLRDVMAVARREARLRQLRNREFSWGEFSKRDIRNIDRSRQGRLTSESPLAWAKLKYTEETSTISKLTSQEFKVFKSHIRNRRWECAIDLLKNLSVYVSPEKVKECLYRHSLHEYEIGYQMNLNPAPRVWDSSAE
jgi:hypothetical protein